MTSSVAERPYGFYSIAPKRFSPRAVDDQPWHGTANGYTNHGCRCDRCRAANTEYRRALRARLSQVPTPEHVHGTANGYRNYGCRCHACREAVFAPRRTGRPRGRPRDPRVAAAVCDAYAAGASASEVAASQGVSLPTVYNILRDEGVTLRRRGASPAAMYIDYCQGLSTAQVAQKWGVSVTTVQRGFTQLGVPLRPRRGGAKQVAAPSGVTLDEANEHRTRDAARRRIPQAEKALAATGKEFHRRVLQARIDHPDAPLVELGKLLGLTKDAYASHLRRALDNAGVLA